MDVERCLQYSRWVEGANKADHTQKPVEYDRSFWMLVHQNVEDDYFLWNCMCFFPFRVSLFFFLIRKTVFILKKIITRSKRIIVQDI